MASITLTNIGKSYGNLTIIDNLNLQVNEGEFVVLVGESGCGKSTTLRMIAGLDVPTRGQVSIGNRDVTDLAPGERNCAMVFQNYALYPHMTVAENMGFGLRLRGMPKSDAEKAVKEAAATLGLTHLLERMPKQLSGGQRQRVAIGRAIVRKPDVFLFDEPLSNLDAKLRIEMRAEIKALHQRLGATMVYVTHDQVEAMTLADRVVVMDKGKIVQAAPPLELYEKPANTFVAGFIGSPCMNLLDATIEVTRNGPLLRLSSGETVVPDPVISKRLLSCESNLTVGIRPEAISRGKSGPLLMVQTVEPLGSHTLAIGALGANKLTVHLSSQDKVKTGDVLPLQIDAKQLHAFDASTGEAL